ncbi:urease accessory protein UreF [Mycolicibacterium neoaurum]|uniref:urease accessory protein UreF n=1 Tax=Mycolicibacterium neoaurum TaxID=1795 RepID=UPI00248C52D0|nr:urease accessory UreF family protein [Mycolicibacterium neoaurum]WBP97096.1 urease accessory protein UreF [Mycolicibacterium neoaurum]WBS11138.1 urease accessory protein UreF [Mycolicibacterium neoaurum]
MPATTTDLTTALALWLQLHDSAFPAGRMVHSHGLEEWLHRRPEAGADAVETVVCGYLRHGVATLDATITAHAWLADDLDTLADLDDLAATYKLFGNTRTASVSAGGQLAATAVDIGIGQRHPYLLAVTTGAVPGHAAVVDGVVQALLGIPREVAVIGVLRSMMASLLSAAVRLGRLGPLQSQRIQLRNAEAMAVLAHAACERPLSELSSVSPALEISGMRHEERTSRLFAT